MTSKTREYDLHKLTAKYVEDKDLRDPAARLFRKLLRLCTINVAKWSALVNDHLRWEITEKDEKKAKEARINAIGNIKSAYFGSPTLTLPKLLAGLSILKMKDCTIIIRVTDHDGNIKEVSEHVVITSSYNDLNKKE